MFKGSSALTVEPEQVEGGEEGDPDGGEPRTEAARHTRAGPPAERVVHAADLHPLEHGEAALGDDGRLQRGGDGRERDVGQRLVAGEDAPREDPAAPESGGAEEAPRGLQQAVPGGDGVGDDEDGEGLHVRVGGLLLQREEGPALRVRRQQRRRHRAQSAEEAAQGQLRHPHLPLHICTCAHGGGCLFLRVDN
jgi:hypothetical protein